MKILIAPKPERTDALSFSSLKNLLILTALMFLASGFESRAASISFNPLTSPCSGGGNLEIVFSGMSTPIHVYYYGKGIYIEDSINTNKDTLFNVKGYITVYASDASGHTVGNTYEFSPFTYTATITQAVCPSQSTGQVSVSGGTAPYTIKWIDRYTKVAMATGANVNLDPGYYMVEITDANGCVYGSQYRQDSLDVYNQSNITATITATKANCTNGTASVTNPGGGTAPYTYLWNNGAVTATITNLVRGYYTVRVTDANGCYQDFGANVLQAKTINVNITPTAATCLQNDGSAIAFGSGGTSPYTYLWDNGQNTQKAINLVNNSYHAIATDANGCIGDGYTYVSASTPITVTYVSTASSCTSATGSATLTINGGTTPYTVHWSTYPAQSGTSASTLSPGLYYFKVTDAVGCVRDGSANVPPVSLVNAYTSSSPATCTSANGQAGIMLISGQSPYTYKWSNNATTATISSLQAGSYTCTVTDNLGCSITKTAYVDIYSPVKISSSQTNASCIYASDGSITANAAGGTSPYTYQWSNGQSTQTISNISQGRYSVYVTDASGCSAFHCYKLDYDPNGTSCYCTITGKVYHDANNNCTQDAGENGIENIMMHCSGYGYAYTNSSGIYSFKVPTGNYTVSEVIKSFYPLASCQNNDINVSVTASSGCSTTVDFANAINPIHDLSIYTTSWYNAMVPGNSYSQKVIVENNGTVSESDIQSIYKHDGQLSFSSFTPTVYTSSGTNIYTQNNSFPSLAPGKKTATNVYYQVPTNIPMGTQVEFTDTVADSTINNWLNDYSPWDNVNDHIRTVVSSYDPNFKEVYPAGKGPEGFISKKDSVLHYTIHFQNTGTYQAQNIELVDSLDHNLNWSTLQPGYSTHNYTTALSENGIISFKFKNINLPPATQEPINSNGMVSYTIHMKRGLTEGSTIRNSADIYFDYNAPVKTNRTLNTISYHVGIQTAKVSVTNGDLQVYPNPARNVVTITVESPEYNNLSTLRIYGISGNLISEKKTILQQGTNSFTEDISALSSGMYIISLQNNSQTMFKRIVIDK